MKKIVCELCEGTEFTKEGGFFVCNGCGTKYSLEEAKRLMKEVDGTIAPTVAATAVPMGNPNQAQIDNALVLATTAFESSNYAEAENYCNRAIEMDATGYKSWFLKAKTVGWSSTYDNPRIKEAAHSFCKAIDFAPEKETEEIKNEAVEELKRLGLAHMELCAKRFANWPENSEYEGFGNAKKELIDALIVLFEHGNAVDIPKGYLEEIANIMNFAGMEGGLSVLRTYNNLNNLQQQRVYDETISMMDNCISIILDAINTSDEDDEEDIERYDNLVTVTRSIIALKACDNFGTPVRYFKKEALKARKEKIEEWEKKAEELKNTVAKKAEEEKKKAEEDRKQRIAAYWEAHADEKRALESEMMQLLEKKGAADNEIEKIDAKIDAINKVCGPIEKETNSLNDQIKDLTARRASLGLFAGKEKKQIANEIDSLQGRIDSVKDDLEKEKAAYDAERIKQLEPVQKKKEELVSVSANAEKRIDAIKAELEKDPGESEA